MKATRTFTDRIGITRKSGEEWLIKMEDTEAHIPDVYEEASIISHTIVLLCTHCQYNILQCHYILM